MSQFVVTISACPRRRGFVAMGAHRSEHIPARVLGPMYRDAVIAEMSETVRTAVAIQLNSNEEAWANGLEVRLGSAVRGMRFGEVTNLGMSYMFELNIRTTAGGLGGRHDGCCASRSSIHVT